jgi:uncharacterized membrane protein
VDDSQSLPLPATIGINEPPVEVSVSLPVSPNNLIDEPSNGKSVDLPEPPTSQTLVPMVHDSKSLQQPATGGIDEPPVEVRVSLPSDMPPVEGSVLVRSRLIIVRVLILFALAVSTAQLADHLSGANAICGFGDSCEQVTNSIYAKPLGIPLPFVGVFGFSLLYALTLVPTLWAAKVVRYLGMLAGVAGICLLTIQVAVLHKICPLCLMVDSASIALAVVVAIRRPEPSPFSRFRLLGWIAAAPVVLFIPLGWIAAQMPDEAPEQVKAHWEGNENGKVTIVEISDFECHFCQQADGVLREVLNRNKEKVNFVRLTCPLPKHQNGMTAARAYYAAGKLGKGEEMAAALFSAESRSRDECEKMAEKLGLDMEQYKKFFAEKESELDARKTLDWVEKWINKTKNSGLPLIWVQDRLLPGVPSAEWFQEAIDKAQVTLDKGKDVRTNQKRMPSTTPKPIK